MPKRQEYVALEIVSEKLDSVVAALRDKLLDEFWSHVPEGAHRDQIRARLENNILSALMRYSDNTEAT
jgi:hypothetical protein